MMSEPLRNSWCKGGCMSWPILRPGGVQRHCVRRHGDVARPPSQKGGRRISGRWQIAHRAFVDRCNAAGQAKSARDISPWVSPRHINVKGLPVPGEIKAMTRLLACRDYHIFKLEDYTVCIPICSFGTQIGRRRERGTQKERGETMVKSQMVNIVYKHSVIYNKHHNNYTNR